MQALKIIITGSDAAGTSQFIRTISDSANIATNYTVTLAEERQFEREISVALDLGTIAIDEEHMLYLCGIPGQERYDVLWEHLCPACLGSIVMVDSTRPGHFAAIQRLLTRVNAITAAPYVVVANKQDDETALPLGYVRRRLGVPFDVPVVPCVATDRSSVKQVLLTLLKQIVAQNA